MQLGHFTKDDEGTLVGRMSSPGLMTIPMRLRQAVSVKGREYYRAFTDAAGFEQEIGRAFVNVSHAGHSYIKLIVDSPTFQCPIIANLFKDEQTDIYDLVWERMDETTFAAALKNKPEASLPMAGLSTPAP